MGGKQARIPSRASELGRGSVSRFFLFFGPTFGLVCRHRYECDARNRRGGGEKRSILLLGRYASGSAKR